MPRPRWWPAWDNSLRALDTDHVDLFQLHGVPPAEYERGA